MRRSVGFLMLVICGTFLTLPLKAQEEEKENIQKQAERKVARMIKSGYQFKDPENLNARFNQMLISKQELNSEGDAAYLIIEPSTRHKDEKIAEDLMTYRLTVELANRIKHEILQMIETELMQSNKYWDLGGHEYFLEVQHAIDEVSLSTALDLAPMKTIYRAKKAGNKNYEYKIGLMYDRRSMLDLFIFKASDYEILDSIYWIARSDEVK